MTGVENSTVIDFVGYDPKTENLTLAMIEERTWDGSEERLLQLQEKINNYLSFVLDGQLARTYADYKNKKVLFQLNCSFPPDDRTLGFLDQVKNALDQYHIGLVLKILKPADEP